MHFGELPDYLARMSLFKVVTGTRQQTICRGQLAVEECAGVGSKQWKTRLASRRRMGFADPHVRPSVLRWSDCALLQED